MGVISQLAKRIGADAVVDAIEVFRPNAEAADGRSHDRYIAALEQLASEEAGGGWFGQFVDGLNRLPRPAMAFGTIGLFAFAMVAPAAFAVRISALDLIPDQLWWLLGSIVAFYFGARELAKARDDRPGRAMRELAAWRRATAGERAVIVEAAADMASPSDMIIEDADDNAALRAARLEGRPDA